MWIHMISNKTQLCLRVLRMMRLVVSLRFFNIRCRGLFNQIKPFCWLVFALPNSTTLEKVNELPRQNSQNQHLKTYLKLNRIFPMPLATRQSSLFFFRHQLIFFSYVQLWFELEANQALMSRQHQTCLARKAFTFKKKVLSGYLFLAKSGRYFATCSIFKT